MTQADAYTTETGWDPIETRCDSTETGQDSALLASTSKQITSPKSPRRALELVRFLRRWIRLAITLQRLHHQPQGKESVAEASGLIQQATEVAEDLQTFERGTIRGLGEDSCIKERTIEENALASAPDFANRTVARECATHAMVSIAVNRILADVLALVGSSNPDLEVQNRKWSERIWRIYPVVPKFRPLGCNVTVAALVLSSESGGTPEKARAIAALEVPDPNKTLQPTRWKEAQLLANCRAITGRISFQAIRHVTLQLYHEDSSS